MAPRAKAKSAYWIGVPEEAWHAANISASRNTNIIAYFRCGFSVHQPGNLTFKISANTRYRLWVNGQPVMSGPCKGDKWRHFYDTVDVSGHLKPGFNCIAVKVIAYPAYEANTEMNMAPLSIMTNGAGPYLMVEGSCKTDKNRVLADITTGYGDWYVSLDEAADWISYPKSFWMGAMEKVDARRLPHGWKDSTEPEGKWYKAVPCWVAEGDPSEWAYGLLPPLPLEERPIPLLYEVKRFFQKEMPAFSSDRERLLFPSLIEGTPVTLAPHNKYVAVLDAGELTTGYLVLNMNGGAGSTVRIRYSESYYIMKNGKYIKEVRDDAENGVILGHEDIYLPSGREETYEPFWFRTFRFIQIEVDTGAQPLSIERPYYLETGYPLEAKTSIQSTAAWVNDVWNISLRTLRRCMHETYEDCPYYEQLQYTMDTRSQILFSFMVSDDTKLARKALQDYRNSLLPNGLLQSRYPSRQPQVIPTFNIFFILMVEDYYWQTGETEHIKEYRSVIDGILNWFNDHIGKSGLIEDLGYWPFVDWVAGWDKGVPPAAEKGPATIHSLLYVAGLQAAARMNELTGRKYLANEYEKRAREIMQQIENFCWSDTHGLFKSGPKVSRFSQHDQVWAVLTGLVKGKRAKSIMKKSLALDDIDNCSYSMRFYLMRALEMTGMYDRSHILWEDWKDMLKMHLTTCPEDNIHARSDCHGWSALPLYEFTRCILGVKPLEPGWAKIGIEPHVLDLPDFSGRVITPKGMVSVSWKMDSGRFSISGQVPDEVPVELYLPDGTKQLYLHGGAFEF
ncbi:MAG TPA: family 78 glycoside hydrolase catalytic domain [Clostridiales bacterium]|nr:family 78 glycoside hydrolase catalytic domain [Clostridiales bacterium]